MMIINEDEMYKYSAIMETPCGQGVFVWRDKDHPRQNQMRDHLKDCKKCQEILSKYKSLDEVPVSFRGYVDKHMKVKND